MTLDAHGFLYDVTGTGLYVHVSTDSTVLRLRKLRLAPKRKTVGSAVIGTVTLTANAPATGTLVALPAANPVTISASFGCITKTASLTVLPSAGRLSP